MRVADAGSADRWRVAGEEPWASARMRCFIVGGRARSRGRVHRTEGASGVAATAPVCSWVVALGCAAFVAFAALAVAVARPSDASRAKKAVMKAVQMLLGWKVLMAPRFRVVRLLTSPIMWIRAVISGSDARAVPIFG